MTYNPNIPQANPSPEVQQPKVKTNFSQFASVFSSSSGGVNYNHSALNTGNQGKHEAVMMEFVVPPLTDDDFVSLFNFTKTSAVNSTQQLFAQIPQFLPNGIPNISEQLTYDQVNTSGPQYQSFFAGAFLVFFGSVSGTTGSLANIVNTITLTPTPSLILAPIASANSVVASGVVLPVCSIGVTVAALPIKNQFTITMQSPWRTGAAVPYNYSWVAICLA
jgi:hypothetical protein